MEISVSDFLQKQKDSIVFSFFLFWQLIWLELVYMTTSIIWCKLYFEISLGHICALQQKTGSMDNLFHTRHKFHFDPLIGNNSSHNHKDFSSFYCFSARRNQLYKM